MLQASIDSEQDLPYQRLWHCGRCKGWCSKISKKDYNTNIP